PFGRSGTARSQSVPGSQGSTLQGSRRPAEAEEGQVVFRPAVSFPASRRLRPTCTHTDLDRRKFAGLSARWSAIAGWARTAYRAVSGRFGQMTGRLSLTERTQFSDRGNGRLRVALDAGEGGESAVVAAVVGN